MQEEQGFFSKWFGFSGWRILSATTRIFTQIIYRVAFLFGLALLIIGYGYVTGSEPGGLPLTAMIVAWYLLFQVVINFIFVEGSR